MQLNGLVKDVEFYKLQYGQYPDSLVELTNKKAFTNIHDASQGFGSGNTEYNYKKIGDKYTLFSAGQDGIPGTKDDFYPDVYIGDSSKIGLIKVK